MIDTLLVILFFIFSRQQAPALSPPTAQWQLIEADYDGGSIAYRALVPPHWIRQEPHFKASSVASPHPLCEFRISEREGVIRLVLHSFPIPPDGVRPPPEAHLARWKRQFDPLDPYSLRIRSESHGGFCGAYLEAQGLLKGTPASLIACTMQLAAPYEQRLRDSQNLRERAKRADYTIKAEGPPELMERHRTVILLFMHSFELVDELPSG